MLPDYYQILGVSVGADLSVIKAAYKARAMDYHPDRGGSHERMVAVNEAWEILSNPALRQTYDEARRSAATAGASNAAEENRRTAHKRAQDYPRKWEDFEKWLRSLSIDFKTAEYGESGFWPSVTNSISGAFFLVLGGLVGFAMGVVLASTIMPPHLVVFITAGGAWLGLYTHKSIRNRLVTSEPTAKPAGDKEGAMMTVACTKCGQKLRLPETQGKIRITCPSCKNTFVR